MRKRLAWVAGLAVASLVAVACGSGGNEGPTTAPTTEAGPTTAESSGPAVETRGVTADTITVGGLTVIEGPGFSWGDTCTGAKVVFDKINDAGGVAGRKINFTECIDDKLDATLNAAGAKKLVDQDKVFAVVPGQSLAFSGSEYLQQQNVPYFGWGTNPYFCGPDQGFGFNGCTAPDQFSAWSKLITLADPSVKTVAIQGLDIEAGHQATEALAAGAEANGLDVVLKDSTMPLQVTDYTPYVQRILAAKPDHVILAVADAISLLNALKAAGYKGTTSNASTYDPSILSNEAAAKALEGQYMDVQFQPFESDHPSVETFKADVAKYGPPDQLLTQQLGQGYASALLFVAILEKVGADLTYDNFYKVANGGGFCWDGDGFTGEICYPEGHTDYSNCEAFVQVVDGEFKPVEPITCA